MNKDNHCPPMICDAVPPRRNPAGTDVCRSMGEYIKFFKCAPRCCESAKIDVVGARRQSSRRRAESNPE